MNTYEGIVIVTFVIIMIIMNILPAYEIKAFKN